MVVHLQEPCSYCRDYISGAPRCVAPAAATARISLPLLALQACWPGWLCPKGQRRRGQWGWALSPPALPQPRRHSAPPPASPLPHRHAHPNPPQKVVIKAERSFDGIVLDRPGGEASRTVTLQKFQLCQGCAAREAGGGAVGKVRGRGGGASAGWLVLRAGVQWNGARALSGCVQLCGGGCLCRCTKYSPGALTACTNAAPRPTAPQPRGLPVGIDLRDLRPLACEVIPPATDTVDTLENEFFDSRQVRWACGAAPGRYRRAGGTERTA